MKLKNVKIGMKVQVKEDAHITSNWFTTSIGGVGEVIEVDSSGHPASVRIQYNNGGCEWGGHKGLRRVKGDK